MSSDDEVRAVPLADSDFPALYQASDLASQSKQRAYLRSVRAGLVLAVLAAACGAVPGQDAPETVDFFAVVTALAFVGALAVELSVFGSRADKTWYEGRALAESTKTLTWRYVVGADPFPVDAPTQVADDVFLARIRNLQHDLPNVEVLPSRSGTTISDRMRQLRSASLAERKDAYLTGRLLDQQSWYAAKAEFHHRRASIYRTLTLLLEVLGIAVALSKAVGVIDFDLAGVVAACVSAFAAWSATRQHQTTGTAYVVTSHELGVISDLLQRDMTEAEWGAAASDAEAAISREHTTWRASHAGQ
ncbi:DUF4231 domain-containing protein [Saccharopolyspora sp. NPDC002578]